MNAELKHTPVSVNCGLRCTYGGNQMLSDNANIRRYGCGIVAAADLFIYLHQHRFPVSLPEFKDVPQEGRIPLEAYRRLLKALNGKYFPIIPKAGVNCLMLTAGLDLMFLRCGSKLRAGWRVTGNKRREHFEDMLARDIPVIFTVGQNFPFVWQKNRLPLYTLAPDGSYRRTSSVRSHYMTATAISDELLTVSSWGVKYYINLAEYEQFSRKYSNSILCNMVYIK